jgi:hypothetical protein
MCHLKIKQFCGKLNWQPLMGQSQDFFKSQKVNNRHDFDWKKNSKTNLQNMFFKILSPLLRGTQKTQNFTI